ncbi:MULTISPECIES: carbohydrate ABC transporter permease [Streptomyces]|uniref:carbohydrate ABC transporter permease n=1 Tax=Streptomyces TaxID=1883 RepID=UPI00225B9750|nr:sugar ABC transporter permease [Streptomyces sp. NBC_01275]MCX4765943.1 sugar ABC transporter permease [Streptomyces sp. NBC_01275]
MTTAPTTTRMRPSRKRTMLLLAAPSVVLLLLICTYPLVYAAIQAVHNGSLINTGQYVGLQNFTLTLPTPEFRNAALFTVVFLLAGVFGSWAIGLGLALLLRMPVPGAKVFRVLLLLPWVMPIVVSATAWNWLVATRDSPLPTIARALGFGDVLFLADPTLAVITVCVVKVWLSFPFMMLMSSSALASVDDSVYEAARLDGAGPWQRFRFITLPMTAKSTYISWVLMAIFCVNDFPTIYLLTGGGPVDATSSLIVLAYRKVFQDFQTGPGVAIAFTMTFVLVIVSALLFSRIRKADVA